MNTIDNKLEKILRSKPFYPGEYMEAISKIKHLILSEIKKVEPEKKTTISGWSEQLTNKFFGFNEAISEYHKALEELLK